MSSKTTGKADMSGQLADALKKKKGDRSLRALARDLGVAVGTAEGWLNAWRTPELKHMITLANYLDTTVGVIVKWEIDAINGKGVCLSSFLNPVAA